MTINLPAPAIFAMYIALAKKQGVPLTRVRGTCQTDILKEYIAQNEYLPAGAVDAARARPHRVLRVRRTPAYPISISGYTSARPAPTRCRSSPSRSPTAAITPSA